MKDQIENYLNRLNNTIEKLSQNEILICCETLLSAYERGSNIFICGNGGSASTASHFACDINKGVSYGEEKRFKIIPLTDNFATITAYSNDVGYEDIFVEQLKNFYQTNDVIIGISGSGNSENVLKAVKFVNDNGGISIGWTGYKGGILKKIAHFSVNANVMDMQTSEDIHLILVHIVMKVLRKKLTGSEEYK
tara:strand:- start:933 stop:1511 length:579 start_codon:yes stop_codon:yes gene_type:complete